MCEHGDTVPIILTTIAELSCTGKERRRVWEIDSCISSLVQAIDRAGIKMRYSCCGHGKNDGEITLADGRVLTIQTDV